MSDLAELFRRADDATKRGNTDAAIRAYQAILENSEETAKARHLAHWGIGEIHLNAKRYDRAEFHLKKALELSPDEAIYHYLLGCTFKYVDDVESALRHLQKAVDLDPSKEQYWAELGWVVGYNRDAAEGIRHLKKSLSINPKSAAVLKDICMLFSKQHRWAEAEVCIEQAEKHAPDNAHIKQIREDVAFFRSKYERLSAGRGA